MRIPTLAQPFRVFLWTVIVFSATPAQAQWIATPYLGVNLAGDAEFRRGGPGGALGYLGNRLGFEFDVQRYHHFFRDKNVDLVPNNCGVAGVSGPCIDLNTDAWSVMGNIIAPIGAKGQRWRAYGTVGLGVIKPWIEGGGSGSFVGRDGSTLPGASTDRIYASQTDVAINIGAGVIRALNNRVGLRADARYFHAFVDEADRSGAYFKDYGFLRATFGLTLRLRGN